MVDPLGGLPDLARRPRALRRRRRPQRIAEDYLRILRFFRIHAWYGDPAGGLDPEALAACAAAADGLARLSRERVGAEVASSSPRPIRHRRSRRWPRLASSQGVLPGADAGALAPLIRARARGGGRATLAAPARGARAAAGVGRGAAAVARRRQGASRRRRAALAAGEPPAAAAYRHGAEVAPRRGARSRAARRGAEVPGDLEAELARGTAARFPVRSEELGLSGPALGRAMRRLEAAWIASDFTLDADELKALAADG